ncbi:hypothetical protein F4820DRAFT_434924 [Hypoxylon rubiginosum]|uniref:Uncharacterized protein n=1 Tax=Hypoxylon rubiginosum TaxID=110542 RepID=A0ACB9YP19_9PEZI|nr:hypothetical protein F4820DRAFT_434924 [Hypoxylon rubiginosum]
MLIQRDFDSPARLAGLAVWRGQERIVTYPSGRRPLASQTELRTYSARHAMPCMPEWSSSHPHRSPWSCPPCPPFWPPLFTTTTMLLCQLCMYSLTAVHLSTCREGEDLFFHYLVLLFLLFSIPAFNRHITMTRRSTPSKKINQPTSRASYQTSGTHLRFP